MFKNRTIQIGLSRPATNETLEDTYADKVTIVAACIDSTVKKVALSVAGYVLLDTFRKVMVAKATKGVS